MTFALDPEFAAALAPNAEAMAESTPPPVGDVKTRRATFEAIIASANTAQPTPPDVTTTDFRAVSSDGATVPLRWYAKEGASPGSAALYLHGGGMIVGNFGLFDAPLSRYVSASGVPMLSVDYRVAPEHPHPVPVEDSYAGLRWLSDHADELGVDPARIAVMGDSAGGGLAAAVALLARDRSGQVVARQILLYPMLDDRNTTPDPEIVPFAGWSCDDNATGWGALVGNAVGGPEVSAVTLALVYLGGVAATQEIFRVLTSQEQQPQIAIVVSTLVIAALFNPMRRRIQAFIDRRFYRSKYDAAKTLEAFSARLRDETDLDRLGEDLVGVVRETMQPAHVSMWLHPDPELRNKKQRAAIRESGHDE